MFNSTELLIEAFIEQLQNGYARTYGGYKSDYADIISWVGAMALENIANSDALYHNVEHAICITLVGQEILRGKHIRKGGVSCENWLHYIISLLCQDIGYVKGVCRQDRVAEGLYATGKDGMRIALPAGATAASLAPYRVDRAKLFIKERFGNHKLINAEAIEQNIEQTRFFVLENNGENAVNYSSLVRGAGLIGQLSNPQYLQRIGALFYELEESGAANVLGYRHPGDLLQSYSKYYWTGIYPHISESLGYLQLTQEGKQIVASLYANVFRMEHQPCNSEVA
ncbi:MAG: metal-dependent phosphohydrolase [Microcoleus sp. SU_5_3]|nr:metal-dependent phosphohydrolase [Microcoleus sp. SU_5_3]NJL65990.1 metal-dependent phosphohydrolase [Microcoleus sp. SM1_3_4]